jgi:hypothetical protein
LSYVHARQLLVVTFVSFFRHERTSTGGKIYTEDANARFIWRFLI